MNNERLMKRFSICLIVSSMVVILVIGFTGLLSLISQCIIRALASVMPASGLLLMPG